MVQVLADKLSPKDSHNINIRHADINEKDKGIALW